ncbi:DUF6444 domain-containing protein [Streptomyces sp. NPDC058623]|uniref:DUF6444 domain-containing protein n=1 Tax=Streptomyces sp. NPDC058623 TaxID=3346563 RepID=UPI0036601B9B
MSESELPSYTELVLLVRELRGELAQTRAELSTARAEITEVRAENAELRRQLGMNSKNSSKPCSSDGFVKPKSLRKSSGRGPGKPTGAPGGTLLQVETPALSAWPSPVRAPSTPGPAMDPVLAPRRIAAAPFTPRVADSPVCLVVGVGQ